MGIGNFVNSHPFVSAIVALAAIGGATYVGVESARNKTPLIPKISLYLITNIKNDIGRIPIPSKPKPDSNCETITQPQKITESASNKPGRENQDSK